MKYYPLSNIYAIVSGRLVTLKLLITSVMIAISGSFRTYVAYLLVGYDVVISNIAAVFLIIYAIYAFDRIKGGEEDNINRKELTGARKDIAYIVCAFSLICGVLILFLHDLILVVIIPFIVGYFYSKKIVIGKYSFKLKGGMGTKNLIVALTWGIFITGVVMKGHSDPIAAISIFSFLFIKTFINTVMNDFSDVTGDKSAGLMTLPICLGEKKTRCLLMGIHMFEHVIIAIIMIKGMLEFEIIILLSCFFSGVIYIFFFTRTSININSSRIKNVSYQLFYRWEFYVAVGLQTLSKILV